jgi:hypothetical protein
MGGKGLRFSRQGLVGGDVLEGGTSFGKRELGGIGWVCSSGFG